MLLHPLVDISGGAKIPPASQSIIKHLVHKICFYGPLA